MYLLEMDEETPLELIYFLDQSGQNETNEEDRSSGFVGLMRSHFYASFDLFL